MSWVSSCVLDVLPVLRACAQQRKLQICPPLMDFHSELLLPLLLLRFKAAS